MEKQHLTEEQVRLIFGLKLKQIRTEKDLSLFGLAKLTGLSKSYLNEIEKGKKYPKTDKIVLLAQALETTYDELVSMKLTGNMAPVSNVIRSGILKEIPLELFGIEEGNLIDIIANAPEKVTAFIGTLFELSRYYNVSRENFYLTALRSYQESHENYFPEIEKEVLVFCKRYQLDLNDKIASADLEEILEQEFGYTIDYDTLKEHDYPDDIRSVFVPKNKKLIIARSVSETQRVFILAKELGYAHLQVKERPLTFSWIRFASFEEVMNNFKASYFAGALILPEQRLVDDLKIIFQSEKWQSEKALELLLKYTDSAETFFQRLTNLLPRHFGLRQLFFLRFGFSTDLSNPRLTKELHLSKIHQPHAVRRAEHYCQRWVSTDILKHPDAYTSINNIRAGIQRSIYPDSTDEYLIITASNADPFNNHTMRSVCIGIQLSPKQKKKIAFSDDGQIPLKHVGITCERCPISNCNERVAAPLVLEQQKRNREIEERVYELILGKSEKNNADES